MFPNTFYPANPVEYLKLELENRLKRRPHYSLRAFARDLEMSPAALNDFMKGKAGLSLERALFVSKKLSLTSEHADHFVDLVASKHARTKADRATAEIRAKNRIRSQTSELSLDLFKSVADWQHFAILELVDLDPKFHSVKALSKTLNLSVPKTKTSIERLVRIELLDVSEDLWKTTSPKTYIGKQTPSEAIQTAHKQFLEKAADALNEQDIAAREFQTGLFTIRADDIPALKEELQLQFRKTIQKFTQKPDKDALYCLGQQFFRLDQPL